MLAFRLIRFQGDDAVEAFVGWSRVKQQGRVIMLVGYVGMAAADDINTSAQAFIKQAIIIIMDGELVTMADQEPDIIQGCFNQALMAVGAIHVACHAQNRSVLRQSDMFKIICSVTAMNQVVEGAFASNDFLQVFAGSMAVGND